MTKPSTNGKGGGIVRPTITKRGPTHRPVRVEFNAAGVTFEDRQALLEKCAAHNVRSCRLEADPVPDVDPHAVSVKAELDGQLVRLGYVPKRLINQVQRGHADVVAIDTFTPKGSATPLWYCKIQTERM